GMAWGEYFFLRQAAYYTLPLMDTFRHAAVFRFFAMFCLLIVAGFSISQFRENKQLFQPIVRRILLILFFSLTIAAVILLIRNPHPFSTTGAGVNRSIIAQ